MYFLFNIVGYVFRESKKIFNWTFCCLIEKYILKMYFEVNYSLEERSVRVNSSPTTPQGTNGHFPTLHWLPFIFLFTKCSWGNLTRMYTFIESFLVLENFSKWNMSYEDVVKSFTFILLFTTEICQKYTGVNVYYLR